MIVRTGGVLCSLALLCAGLAAGCDPGCGRGETRADVHNGDSNAYVCLPADDENDDDDRSDSPPPRAPADPPASSSPPPHGSAPPSSSSSTCATLEAGPMDVDIVTKVGAPDAFAETAAPDGSYELVQASSYGVGGGAPAVETLRASLDISGARLIIGTQATTGTTLEANESFTLTFTPGVLTKVCESRPGTVANGLFRGAPGATRVAHLGWSASTSLLTLVMTTPAGELELLFTPL